MINIVNNSHDPYFNLALEEYFLKNKDLKDDVLILWQNEPTIVIGKNQNTYEELNMDYVINNNIHVARRMSGGGAVYHDLGNLNYTIIKNNGELYRNNFAFFALPVIDCLKRLGIIAEFNGRNDITIEDKKFSGNAQYFFKHKVLHHGTLIFSSDLTVLAQALHVKKDKIESKGIKSVKSRVTNISDYLKYPISLCEFRDRLIISMFHEVNQEIKNYILKPEDENAILELRNSKYNKWDWNYGKSPEMNYHKSMRFTAGVVGVSLNIKNGMISDCKINGDFFEVKPINELEHLIEDKKYDLETLKNLTDEIEISEYIHLLNNEDLLKLLF